MYARVHTAALWGGRFIVGYLTINHLRSRPPRAPTLVPLPLSPPFGSFDQGPSPLSIPSPPPTERISASANWKGGIAERIALWWLKGGGWALLVVGPPCRAPPPHHAAAVGGLERLVGRGGGPIGQGAGPRRLARLLQITQAQRRQRLQRAEGRAVDLNSSYGIPCMCVVIQCTMCSGRYLVEVVGAAAGLVHPLHPAPPTPRPGRQHRRTLTSNIHTFTHSIVSESSGGGICAAFGLHTESMGGSGTHFPPSPSPPSPGTDCRHAHSRPRPHAATAPHWPAPSSSAPCPVPSVGYRSTRQIAACRRPAGERPTESSPHTRPRKHTRQQDRERAQIRHFFPREHPFQGIEGTPRAFRVSPFSPEA